MRQLNRPDILDWKLTVAHSPHNPLRDESEIMIVKYVELLKLAHYPVEFDSGKEACLEREKRELDAQKTGKTVCIHVFWKRVERSYACVRSRPERLDSGVWCRLRGKIRPCTLFLKVRSGQ